MSACQYVVVVEGSQGKTFESAESALNYAMMSVYLAWSSKPNGFASEAGAPSSLFSRRRCLSLEMRKAK